MFKPNFSDKPATASLLLRLGLAFVFLYAAFGSLFNPEAWASYLPSFILKTSFAFTLLKVFSVYEVGLSLWLLSNKYTQYAAILCALTLAGIILAQPSGLFITFRDIGLLFMAVTLAVLAWPQSKNSKEEIHA